MTNTGLDKPSVNRESTWRAIEGFRRAAEDFQELQQILRTAFDELAPLCESRLITQTKMQDARERFSRAVTLLPVAMDSYEVEYPQPDPGFCSRIIAFDSGKGSKDTPTLLSKIMIFSARRDQVAIGTARTGTEYTRHALVRWLERTEYDTMDFLADLQETEFLSTLILAAAYRGEPELNVIVPMGSGALLGSITPHEFKAPVLGLLEAQTLGSRRQVKVHAAKPAKGIERPGRIAWKTYLGESELRDRQLAALQEIESIVAGARKPLRTHINALLVNGLDIRTEDQALLERSQGEIEIAQQRLRTLMTSQSWLLQHQRGPQAEGGAA